MIASIVLSADVLEKLEKYSAWDVSLTMRYKREGLVDNLGVVQSWTSTHMDFDGYKVEVSHEGLNRSFVVQKTQNPNKALLRLMKKMDKAEADHWQKAFPDNEIRSSEYAG